MYKLVLFLFCVFVYELKWSIKLLLTQNIFLQCNFQAKNMLHEDATSTFVSFHKGKNKDMTSLYGYNLLPGS